MARCKYQSTDGKKCFRPGASLRVCWPYNEPPIRREQCKHFVVEDRYDTQ